MIPLVLAMLGVWLLSSQARAAQYAQQKKGKETMITSLLSKDKIYNPIDTTTPRAVLVVGHSQKYGGASGGGIDEHEFWLPLVKRIVDVLTSVGVPVIATHRKGEGEYGSSEFWQEYREEKNTYNAFGARPVIHFHSNAANGKARGHETLYTDGSTRGLAWATLINDALTEALGNPDRGAKPLGNGDRAYDLVHAPRGPGVIIEAFFIDNKQDRKLGKARKDQLVTAIASAIRAGIEKGI